MADFKRARRNVPCINHITILPDFDLGIGLRKTAQHWRVALQTVRQHLVVRRKLEAAQSNAIPPDAIACEAVPSVRWLRQEVISRSAYAEIERHFGRPSRDDLLRLELCRSRHAPILIPLLRPKNRS